MDYGRIISESFRISWRHKLLWIFGLFAGSSPSGFNMNIPGGDDGQEFEELSQLSDALSGLGLGGGDFSIALLAPLLMAITLFALLFIVMHLISVPALIDAVNRIRRGDGRFRLGQSFSVGLDFFLRILGLGLLAFVSVVMAIGVMALVVIVAIAIHWSIVILVALVLIPAFFGVIWLVTNLVALAQRSLVVRNSRIADAIEEAVRLFRGNLKENAVIFLIYIGLSIGIGMAALIVWMICGIPIALLAMAFGVGLVPTILLVILLGLPVSLVVGGFTGSSLFNMYTLFYFELVEPTPPSHAMPAPPPASA